MANKTSKKAAVSYVLRPPTGIEVPASIAGHATTVVDSVPQPPEGVGLDPVGKELAITDQETAKLEQLGATRRIGRVDTLPMTSCDKCGCHEAIGTVLKLATGNRIGATESVGTWASMAIAEAGIPGLSGHIYTPLSTVSSQPLEILGYYHNDSEAALAVYDWSCVDEKPGTPACSENTAWVRWLPFSALPDRYKFFYWDGSQQQRAVALADYSKFHSFVVVDTTPLPAPETIPLTIPLKVPIYLNLALILNWDTSTWDVFYQRRFLARDMQAHYGPRAFVELVSTAGCPELPRLGFREVRARFAGGDWQLAAPGTAEFRFDLPSDYLFVLLDPNHTWAIAKKWENV